MNALHYSNAALMRRCGGILVVTALVGFDQLFRTRHILDLLRAAPVLAPVIVAVVLYLVGATIVMMLSLARHGAVAVACDETGIDYHTAWTKRHFAWNELSNITLDVRYNRYSHYFVVALRRPHHVQNCFTIDARLLAETLDQAGQWTDAAERRRLAHGGPAYVAPTGLLAGWSARDRAREVAAGRAASRA